jgi:hypothetical protein
MPLRPFCLRRLRPRRPDRRLRRRQLGAHLLDPHQRHDAKGVLKVVDALQCPQTMGSLTRKGSARTAATVCTYVGPKGAEVTFTWSRSATTAPSRCSRRFETFEAACPSPS